MCPLIYQSPGSHDYGLSGILRPSTCTRVALVGLPSNWDSSGNFSNAWDGNIATYATFTFTYLGDNGYGIYEYAGFPAGTVTSGNLIIQGSGSTYNLYNPPTFPADGSWSAYTFSNPIFLVSLDNGATWNHYSCYAQPFHAENPANYNTITIALTNQDLTLVKVRAIFAEGPGSPTMGYVEEFVNEIYVSA
jgi:hypothetical protein